MTAAAPRVVVIGAGANELVAAHLLARAGRQVTVLQEHAVPDWQAGWVPGVVLRALGLEGKVSVHAPDPWLVALLPGGGQLELHRDMRATAASLRRLSARDAQKWPRFCERMARLAAFMEKLCLAPPASPLQLDFALRVRGPSRRLCQLDMFIWEIDRSCMPVDALYSTAH